MFHFGLPMNSGTSAIYGMPVMFGSSGMSAASQNAIIQFDSAFPDMQNKIKFIASIPSLSPQQQEEYTSLTKMFKPFERTNAITNIDEMNCNKIALTNRMPYIVSKINNLYNQLSTSIVSNPVMVTTTTTPVPSQGSGSKPPDVTDLINKMRNERMS